jgi:hypothetical protein
MTAGGDKAADPSRVHSGLERDPGRRVRSKVLLQGHLGRAQPGLDGDGTLLIELADFAETVGHVNPDRNVGSP